MARKSKGRQKVDMVKIQNESNLQVTFSKRRSGLFKKASELCTLCGIEVALIVFSPAQKVYSFGHPCLGTVLDKYTQKNPLPTNGTKNIVDAHRAASIESLNKEFILVENILEAERKHGDILYQMRSKEIENQKQYWWEAPIKELNLQQLEQLMKAMEGLKKNVDHEISKQMIEATNNRPSYERNMIFGSNGPHSNVGSFIPFGGRAYGAREKSLFGVATEIEIPETVNVNHKASGSSSSSNIPNASKPCHVHKFF